MIRNRIWDAAWIMNGPIIGLLLIPVSMYVPPRLIVAVTVGVLGMAHRISPMMLAATHPEIRKRTMARPLKFFGLPIALMCLCAAVGWLFPQNSAHPLDGIPSLPWRDLSDLRQPLLMLGAVYIVWNAWHFGMQNFGILSIYR